MKMALVLTTINVPDLVLGYADNFEKYGHKDQVEILVVGDLKTPAEAGESVRKLQRRGFQAEYLDVSRQKKWLQRFPDLETIIPYNSDNRRNVGFLLAVERDADVVITIDDDNYVTDDDYFAGHNFVGSVKEFKSARSSNGWYNICSMLETDPPRRIYPRGFPYSKRWSDEAEFGKSSGRVVLNAGLWLEDPDVDAVTRLNEPLRVVRTSQETVMFDRDIYCPVNTQNTAFHRDILPCYYYITMNARIEGGKIDRYGDIWSGFFAQKVINHMGDRVTAGPPEARHVRNKHNLLKDLREELWGMILTESLVSMLDSIRLKSTTYADAYKELAAGIQASASANEQLSPDVKQYFSQISKAMVVWVDVCKEIMR
jgi:glycosyltransferase involved in cell wall biosynthesis